MPSLLIESNDSMLSIQVYMDFWMKVLQSYRGFLILLADSGMFSQYSCVMLKIWWKVSLIFGQKQEGCAKWKP